MRQLPTDFSAALEAGVIVPAILADLTFVSGVEYVWTGFGNITWRGNVYRGVGTLAGVGEIKETIAVRADGTSVTLNGIDPRLLTECLSEIQLGAPATLWLGVLSQQTGATSTQTAPVGVTSLTWTQESQSGQLVLAGASTFAAGDIALLSITSGAVSFNGQSVTMQPVAGSSTNFVFRPLSTLYMDDVPTTASAGSAVGVIATRLAADAVPMFAGLIDKPTIRPGTDSISLTIALETRFTNLQRASNRRLSSADQRIDYPTDTGLGWVETLQDQAFYAGVR